MSTALKILKCPKDNSQRWQFIGKGNIIIFKLLNDSSIG
jgi:hypothetical protein